MQWSAMNHGDVFILDLGRVLFVWMGKEGSVTEKRQVRFSVYLYQVTPMTLKLVIVTSSLSR